MIPTSLRLPVVLGVSIVAVAAARPLTAQDAQGTAAASAPKAAAATRTAQPPAIDGVLDDAVWSSLQPLDGFVQWVPLDGQPVSERTEVRVAYDAAAVYVGAWLYDADPSGIVDGNAIRDASLDESDAVLLVLDTFRDEQNGFVFGTNPAGIEYDAQLANEGEGGGNFGGGGGGMRNRQQGGALGGVNVNWDGSWEVATSRDERGWFAEFRIPFSTLRYAAGEDQRWGFNVARRIRRRNEESTWSAVPRQFNLFRLQYAGELGGLEPPELRTARVTPYLLSSTARDYRVDGSEFATDPDVGVDAKVQLTQGLTLDATVNTDFAQVEVDEAQVNLTRFAISFPEKRPFFLENAGFFSVGGGQSELFFSRRIGIASGTPVPIEGGGRLSGRVAGFNLGLLRIRTDALRDPVTRLETLPGNDFSVARIARELPNRSRVGVAYMGRDAVGVDGSYNNTFAVDGQVGIGDEVTLSSFAAKTETPGRTGADHAFDLSGSYTTRSLRLSGSYRELGEDFNPEVGFVPRSGYRSYSGMWMAYYRPGDKLPSIREFRPHMNYNTYRNLETGFEETARLHVDSHIEWHSGFFVSPAMQWNREGLVEPFEVSPGIFVAPGVYDGWEAAWRFNTNESAALSFNGLIDWGSFLSGTRHGLGGTLTYRSGARLTTSLRAEHNDVKLLEGAFSTTLVGVKLGYFFTPRIYLQSLVQYSDQLDSWSTNLRFGWLNTGGTGLFVVYNESQGVDALSEFGTLSRAFIVKFTRQFDVWQW